MRSRKSPQYIVQGRHKGPITPNVEQPGETISEMSAISLVAQGAKAAQYNVGKVLRIGPGNPLSKGSLASYKRKDMEKSPVILSHCGGL